MKISYAFAAIALLVTGSLAGPLPSASASASASASEASSKRPCNVEYQNTCVQWYTNASSCFNIFNTNASATKKQACAIWRATGEVMVIW